MNASNTKLTKDQKIGLKDFQELLRDLKGEIFTFSEYNCTIAVVPEFNNSKMVRVSVSTLSDNEKKFRNKVGQYYALEKMFDTWEYIKLPNNPYGFLHIADTIGQLCD